MVKFSLYVSLSYSVLLYFKYNGHLSIYSFSFSPRRRLVLLVELSGKYILLFFLYLNSVSYSLPLGSAYCLSISYIVEPLFFFSALFPAITMKNSQEKLATLTI